jgi:D-alanyl-D-alanine carboxypeptidase/D-alanyl-D-alanine-endopeptidase (penicillin-binding protein 4)
MNAYHITKNTEFNMNSFTNLKVIRLGLVVTVFLLSTTFSTVAQTKTRKPLFQNITIQNGKDKYQTPPRPTPTPLVKRTSSSAPTSATTSAATINRRTSIPALAEVSIPGYSGVLIESENGSVVMESYSNHAFNPASNVKVATSFAVLKTFGPNFRFSTKVWTDGVIDRASNTLIGNLYVSGRDPIFNYEHAVTISNELNRLGIRKVDGDIIVTDNFVMNYSGSSQRSGNSLLQTLNGATRNNTAKNAWQKFLNNNAGKYRQVSPIPSVFITGDLYVEGLPSNVRLLFSHESAPLREIVKATMSYSNNFLSERLGDMLGGAYAVARIVQMNARVAPHEFSLQTCSGLGINRVTPQAQMKLLRTFRKFLKKHRMTFADVMPVAGLDEGTLRNRFKTGLNLGSVVGKTGTLRRTDRGVSTLSGEITTRRGRFLFVIFNQRGNVTRFRSFQNFFVPLVQNQLGGAIPMGYTPITMEKRLSKSRIQYPRGSRVRVED